MKFDLRSAFNKENVGNTAVAALTCAAAVASVVSDHPAGAAVMGFLAGINVILAGISNSPS